LSPYGTSWLAASASTRLHTERRCAIQVREGPRDHGEWRRGYLRMYRSRRWAHAPPPTLAQSTCRRWTPTHTPVPVHQTRHHTQLEDTSTHDGDKYTHARLHARLHAHVHARTHKNKRTCACSVSRRGGSSMRRGRERWELEQAVVRHACLPGSPILLNTSRC
jgi:hypothetical protein